MACERAADGACHMAKAQHSPSRSAETDPGDLRLVARTCESLGEKVGEVVGGSAVGDRDLVGDQTFASEMVAYIDMFRSLVELIIVSIRNRGLVVGVQGSRSVREQVEIIPRPDGLVHVIPRSYRPHTVV